MKSPLRVLLTDDDEDDRLIFQEIFDEMDNNIIVDIVHDGKEMMDFLTNEINSFPHIIFLDLNMPNESGLECLQKIRADHKYNDIAIAIYSTSDSNKDIDDTFSNGANIYITKPGDYDELKKVLKKSLTAVRINRNAGFDRSIFVLKI